MVDEEHHRLVLGLVQRDEVEVVADLDVGVLQPLGQRGQRRGVHEVPALDATTSSGAIGATASRPRPAMPLGRPSPPSARCN